GVARRPDILEQLAAQNAQQAGEAIDLDVRHCHALREIEKWCPAALVDVPVDALGRIETFVAEGNALVVRSFDELTPRQIASGIDLCEPCFDLATGVDSGTAVEVGAARRASCGRVIG